MSNVFIFITGHSGDEFIKFQDWEEITSTDIADAFAQMHKQRRYKKVFWVSDTCQASTLQNQFYSPEIVAIGSSAKNQNSYSHHMDPQLGVAVIDRFTYYSLDFMNKLTLSSKSTLKTFMDIFDPKLLYADPQMRTDLFSDDISNTLLTEFFASTGRMRFQNTSLQLARASAATEGACAMPPSAAHGRANVVGTGLQAERMQEGTVPDLLFSKLALLRELGGGGALPASFEAVSAPPPGGGPAAAMSAIAAGCALAFGALAWLAGAVL
ncbi:unnamed protein product [Prorocentrum cordatum]|uniref:GPI-anchor transamidase n=1 Tax=Prorocentrum cordatum TaxID=2364126 RepID=A0ABN9R9I8_9DINO|nr:unnamed protein product [Polarella glacialis]